MNLVELTAVAAAALPIAEFRDHLRLGSGFADDGGQDGILEAYLRAAIASIEGRTGKVLLARDFSWDLTRWFACDRQGLPVAPVSALLSLTQVAFDGTETALDLSDVQLREDLFRPQIVARALPSIPTDGVIRITFTAGFGASWSAVPADLAQAVFLLAAGNYEARAGEFGSGATLPFGVLSLIERYKTVRLTGDSL